MTEKPKISVVTPSYNQGQFLEEAILSIINQNYENLEYVVVDGGSTDESVNIIKKYSDKLHYWISEKDKGHGDALNKGFSKTSGEIMAWLNSDDKYMPWTFDVVAEIFTQFPHVNWIVGFNAIWSDKGFLTTAMRMPKNIFDYLLGNYKWIQQESVFWRRNLWERTGGYINNKYEYMIDGELWSRYFLVDDLYTVDCILGGYRRHSSNRAKYNYDSCLYEMENVIREMRNNVSSDKIRTYKSFKRIQYLKKLPLLKYLPLNDMCRLFYPSIYNKGEYKNLFYEDGKWRPRFLPFYV